MTKTGLVIQLVSGKLSRKAAERIAAIARTDEFLLGVASDHSATFNHDVYLTSGEGWFCLLCEHDLMLVPSIPYDAA
jgi:hypothetical protein